MLITRGLVSIVRPLVDRLPRVATLYRRLRDELDCMQEPNPTPWGFKMSGNASMATGAFEPTETELVRNILNRVDVLVNVGANVGYYCCHALSMGKSVIAFEPIERNTRHLCKNIKANGWTRAEVYPIALSNSVGILEIYGGDTGASVLKGWAGTPESHVRLVPCSTMDIVLGTRLEGKRALVLIDIEGAEQWMLEGAKMMLANNPRPIWVLEIVTREHQPRGQMNPNLKSTFQLFFESGYQAFTFDRDMRPVTMATVESVLNGSQRFTTYNFLFSESRLPL